MRDYDPERDEYHGYDSNAREKDRIIKEVLESLSLDPDESNKKILRKGPIGDITEYGRVVHAEMEALLACGRNGISTKGASIYCTTFPCHNCAKHIIAAGVDEVVFVEPYPKSKALEFHPDAVTLEDQEEGRLRFKPFVGVGPRRFFNLFAMKTGMSQPKKRKNKVTGDVIEWKPNEALPRMKMIPVTYIEVEEIVDKLVEGYKEKLSKIRDLKEINDGTPDDDS